MAPQPMALGWLQGKLEVLAELLFKGKPEEEMAELMDVAVRIMSGDIVAELKVPNSCSVEQIKAELAKVDQSGTPASRHKLFLEDEDLDHGLTLKELCKEEEQKITLNLIRLGGYSIQKKVDLQGGRFSEYLLSKFVLTGDSGTGKTNLMTRFARNTFTDEFISTIGIDSSLQTLTVDEKICVKCQISDNAGVEPQSFRTMTPHYRGAHAIIVVCDVTSRALFDNLSVWLDLINRHADKDVALCIVANKIDLEEQRQVTDVELRAFAATHGIECFETSAKTDHNVDEPFFYLTQTILDKRRSMDEDFD
jgi:Ras-related protein Rab-1A